MHSPVKDSHAATARLSYIEVTFAGQAFRLGRYPIYFQLNGDMSTSYIRGLSIHESFNRAITLKGVQNTIVDKTVAYNIMGGAIFLEDGSETGNILQNNLLVWIKSSSSLLNDDITPAAFWLKNPNNTIQHNAAAGGSHYGYWYGLPVRPESPSSKTSGCPNYVQLGIFQNNSAHSFGWHGLWIFESYYPLKLGCGGCNVKPAVFRGFTAWNNRKGAEAINSGALHFESFVVVHNKLAGIEFQKVNSVPLYTKDSPSIKNSLIIGTTTERDDNKGCTTAGIVLPDGAGFQVKNVTFINFANSCSAIRATKITGSCSYFCGGYRYHIEGVSFINSPNKASFASEWEAILIDKDGSLTGKGENEWKVLPASGTLPSDCEDALEFSSGFPAKICPPQYNFHQHAFTSSKPESLKGKNLIIINQYGNTSVSYNERPLGFREGWMFLLVDGETYKFEFENAQQIINISYSGMFSEFEVRIVIYVKQHSSTAYFEATVIISIFRSRSPNIFSEQRQP